MNTEASVTHLGRKLKHCKTAGGGGVRIGCGWGFSIACKTAGKFKWTCR